MFDKALRKTKERVLKPVADRVGQHATPTQITLLGGVVGMAAALSGWQGAYSLGLGLWLLNRVLDGLDGTVARRFQRQSDLGGYVDILVDATVYAAIPVALALASGGEAVYLGLIAMLAVFYINQASWLMLSSILEKRRHGAARNGEMTSVAMTDGLIEGGETIVFYALFFLMPQHLALLYTLMALLVAATIVQRLLWARRHLT